MVVANNGSSNNSIYNGIESLGCYERKCSCRWRSSFNGPPREIDVPESYSFTVAVELNDIYKKIMRSVIISNSLILNCRNFQNCKFSVLRPN